MYHHLFSSCTETFVSSVTNCGLQPRRTLIDTISRKRQFLIPHKHQSRLASVEFLELWLLMVPVSIYVDQRPNDVDIKVVNRDIKGTERMKHEWSSPSQPRNLAVVQCVMSHLVEFLFCPGDITERKNLTKFQTWPLFKAMQPLLYPGKNKSAPKESVSSWAWTCAFFWVLPPWRHILDVFSASLLF